jgi:hypothetical protein
LIVVVPEAESAVHQLRLEIDDDVLARTAIRFRAVPAFACSLVRSQLPIRAVARAVTLMVETSTGQWETAGSFTLSVPGVGPAQPARRRPHDSPCGRGARRNHDHTR